MAEKVKRCPFCGSKVTVKVPFTRNIIENPNFIFVCLNSDCGAIIMFNSGTSKNLTQGTLKERWNRRVDNDKV